MQPSEFAAKYFHEYKQRGIEAIPLYCPFCKGGERGDKHSFALNLETGAFNCKRGSCGAEGSFTQLLKEYGEMSEQSFEFRPRPKKSYKKPKTETSDPSSKVENYLEKRLISKSTWQRRGVKESSGNIVFPYYQDGELVLNKFRKPEKYNGKGPKMWREEGGKPVFWGMDDCDPVKPLVIVEGEFDALALDEAGVENVVSVPSGAEDLTCIDECWDWLQQFKKIIIWPDSDQSGQDMCRKLIAKLGAWRCYVVPCEEYKDPNECLFKVGPDETRMLCYAAKEVPISGLLRLADVQPFQWENLVRVKSTIQSINSIIGGYIMGQTSIWTGINASGKSTFLGQELLGAVDQGYSVCAYSGELPGAVFRYWIDLQAAGSDNISVKLDEIKGDYVCYLRKEVSSRIREWYRDRFFLYDSFGGTEHDDLLKVFEYAAMRYDCKIFLVDNLMTSIYASGDRDYYRKQSNFIGKIVEFAHKHSVHVHIVAHPRKNEGRLSKMDVLGSSEITNRVDNVFAMHRVTEEEAEKGTYSSDAVLDIFKNRFLGQQEKAVALNFEPKSKRFYMAKNSEMLYYDFGCFSRAKGD